MNKKDNLNKTNNLNKNSISSKIIKDPLYNYIDIEIDICDKIIDSKYFQRLRRIEQTSMRCLYPSARHDRFVHSLGTYHLAKMAISAINSSEVIVINTDEDNSKVDTKKIRKANLPKKNVRKSFNFTFEMAALLHDIGHSPFSHTLEQYFEYFYQECEVKKLHIRDIFFSTMDTLIETNINENHITFKDDCIESKASPHEISSCIIIIKHFKGIINELARKKSDQRGSDIDFCFLTRCILGALYSEKNIENDYKNCLIKLLNSSIDVDKLDYISRDSKISGYDNTSVDTSRLINSFALALNKVSSDNYELCLVFKKTGIPIIQNVIASRNSLHTWIYSHHKVKYESDLLVKSIKNISLLNKNENSVANNDKLFISKYFSVKSIEEKLVCDDSIWNLFMKYKGEVNEVAELIDRSTQKLAIWKSYAEFQAYFNSGKDTCAVGEFDINQMKRYLKQCKEEAMKVSELEKYINNYERLNKKNDNEVDSEYKINIVICDTSLASIRPDAVLIYINNRLHSFDRILGDTQKSLETSIFFYAYGSKKIKDILNSENYKFKDEFIRYIKNFDGFKLKPQN